jgi:hypothetical protein
VDDGLTLRQEVSRVRGSVVLLWRRDKGGSGAASAQLQSEGPSDPAAYSSIGTLLSRQA